MSLLVWVMMAIALWHFTIWLPDRFWGGIVGALLAAVIGSVVLAFIVSGLTEGGLTAIGVREYATRDAARGARLMRQLLGLRVVLSLVGVNCALIWALSMVLTPYVNRFFDRLAARAPRDSLLEENNFFSKRA